MQRSSHVDTAVPSSECLAGTQAPPPTPRRMRVRESHRQWATGSSLNSTWLRHTPASLKGYVGSAAGRLRKASSRELS